MGGWRTPAKSLFIRGLISAPPLVARVPRPSSVLVVLAVLLAGCSGFGGTGTPTEPVTPAPVPAATPTATPHDLLAPGLSFSGVTDAYTLADAHAGQLQGTSYTVRTERTIRTPDGRQLGTESGVVCVAASGTFRSRVTATGTAADFVPGASGRVDRWSDGEQLAVAVTANGSTRYGHVPRGSFDPQRSRLSVTRERLFVLFSAVDTRVTDRFAWNGTTVYRVESTGVTDPDRLADAEVIREPRNVSFTALVDARGVVRAYTLRYRATAASGEPVVVALSVTTERIGATTVERPDWYERALAVGRGNASATPGG